MENNTQTNNNEETEKSKSSDSSKVAENQNKDQKIKRKKAIKKISIFLIILAVLGIIYGAYWLLYGRNYVKTDDAYVNGNQNIITSQVGGTVTQIYIEDTQFVEKGQLLAVLDDIDYKIALENAAASLGKAVRAYSNLSSDVAQSEDNVKVKESQLKKAETDFAMDRASYNAGLISRHQYETSKNNLNIAISSLNQSEKALENAKVQADSSSIYNHPDVQQAIAAYKNAYVNLMRTKIYAPESGNIAKKSVFLGQKISPSQELMTIIDLDNVWVDANLKETQMKDVKPGDEAELISDINGKKYIGYVQGLSAGTGSSLSLLPAQNATGNWIKIVQRVPVRIIIDKDSLKKNGMIPIGSSMEAIVDIRKETKNILPYTEKSSNLYSIDENVMNKEIDNIIKANIGKN
ncbi:efflux RND transporter periplasmic adaptor subunit [uncultured Fusobacterium sp.]|uniref:efflux RND transporter periplasmic adaptor subunit n=1 Tax=uncultured Fusobacterium sp. TaxID=159267 RepID=UPI0025DD8A5F|nr:efflux RND transporter periplasmic adaptor subunit [uncultured Fusobacterium sp.]